MSARGHRLGIALAILGILILGPGGWVLFGVDDDGPLRLGGFETGSPARPGEIHGLVMSVSVDGGPVRVTEVKPGMLVNGVEFLEPVVRSRRGEQETLELDAWPPRRTRPLTSGRLGDGDQIVIGIRTGGVRERQAVRDLQIRYERGWRRWQQRYSLTFCADARRGSRRNVCFG